MSNPQGVQRSSGRALGDAAYREEDFPAMRLARSARIVRRMGYGLLWVLLVMVLLMLFAPWQQSISGQGAIIAFDPLQRPRAVEAPVKGRISSIGPGIKENALVEKGQLLFQIEDFDPLKLSRLEQQVANARNEIANAEVRLERAKQRRENQERIIDFATEELDFMSQSRDDLMSAIDALIEQAKNKVQETLNELDAAKAKRFQTKADHIRQKNLFAEGIASEAKHQDAEQKYLEAEAKVAATEQKLAGARNGVKSKTDEKESKRGEIEAKIKKTSGELEKARAELVKADIEINKTSEEINQKRNKLLDQESKLAVQQTQEVRAPLAGRIMSLSAFDSASTVKPGQQLCRIVPDATELAAQVWVSGNDAPLISPGRHVRLQFEGWPAVQFSGWPSVAQGTFGGEVALVDAADDGTGKYRVVIRPASDDVPWPVPPKLRQGARTKAWVLLDQVPLAWELWRRMNGFPPSLKSREEGKDDEKGTPKPPKIKI